MFGPTAPTHPILHAIGLVVLGVLASMLLLYVTPLVAIFLLHRGWSWYLSPESRREKAGLVLLAGGIALLYLSYVVYAGLLRMPEFTDGLARGMA